MKEKSRGSSLACIGMGRSTALFGEGFIFQSHAPFFNDRHLNTDLLLVIYTWAGPMFMDGRKEVREGSKSLGARNILVRLGSGPEQSASLLYR